MDKRKANGWESCCMIWTPKGAWFQKRDRLGQLHLSDLGQLSLYSVESFCQSKGVELLVKRSEQSACHSQ